MSSRGPGADRNVYLLVSGFALKMVAILVILLFIGLRLDAWLATRPWFTIAFGFLGIVGGVLQLIKDVSRWGE
jgi:F0F1-type ATP synthase assembly protein I